MPDRAVATTHLYGTSFTGVAAAHSAHCHGSETAYKRETMALMRAITPLIHDVQRNPAKRRGPIPAISKTARAFMAPRELVLRRRTLRTATALKLSTRWRSKAPMRASTPLIHDVRRNPSKRRGPIPATSKTARAFMAHRGLVLRRRTLRTATALELRTR